MSDLNFKIEGKAQNATQLNVEARQFSIVVDEPPQLGGNDQGANPVEYLLASYAGCINVVAHLTARELGINVESLRIAVNGNLNPAKFLGESDAERAGFKHIEVEFDANTDASAELNEKWISEIKRRCPVNDNLANSTPLSFNVVNALQTA